MKNKCRSFEFENIDIAFQHSVLPENIIGQVKEFDDHHTAHKRHGELEKSISNLENENRRIDALDIVLLLYDFPKRHQIRELSQCHLKKTRDKVWLDDYCEKKAVQATTVLRINNNKAYDQRRNILNTMVLSIHFLNVRWSIQYQKSN